MYSHSVGVTFLISPPSEAKITAQLTLKVSRAPVLKR